jgi:hypothetical protein
MFYLRYLCLFGSSLPPPVCRSIHVLFMFQITLIKHGSSYKQAEVKTNQANTNNVNKTMFYLRYLCLFGSSLPPPVCRRIHVLFMFFVFV